MKPLNWVELTRQQIKARHCFGWSIQGIEKQNKEKYNIDFNSMPNKLQNEFLKP